MTDTATTPEVRRLVLEIMASSDLGYPEALAAAEAKAAADAERTAQARAKAQELADSYEAMMTCPVPGCRHAKAGPTGLCERHGSVVFLLEAEAVAAEKLPGGGTVRAWVADFVKQRREQR
jgi:hypothetical protein